MPAQGPRIRFIFGKLLYLVPTFLGITIIAFGFVRILPGDPVADPITQAISTEELKSLVGCLSEVLSELEAKVLAMYLEGRSYEEIGEILECNPKAVDNALQRVKRKIVAHQATRAVPA